MAERTDEERLDWLEQRVCDLSGNVQPRCSGVDAPYSPWDITVRDSNWRREFVHQGNLHAGSAPSGLRTLREAIDAAMARTVAMDAEENHAE